MDKTVLIIVAGGSGSRMGGAVPKQFLELAGRPVLMHTIERMAAALPEAERVVVLPQGEIAAWEALCRRHGFDLPVRIVAGGATRFDSVAAGLEAVDGCAVIGVHDGVRPLVSAGVVRATWSRACACGAAIPVVEPVDSLREMAADGSNRAVERSRFRAVQTPQFFAAPLLKAAYAAARLAGTGAAFTDDATVVEAAGHPIALCPGDPSNIKVTTPGDLLLAEVFLKRDVF